MDRGPNESFEILDFGPGSLPDPAAPDSDSVGDEPQQSDRFSRRVVRRWGGVAMVFLAGAGAGAYGWDTWRDREQTAADKAAVLIAGGMSNLQENGQENGQEEGGTVRFSVVLENLGDYPIRVNALQVTGWTRPADREPLDVEIKSGESAEVTDVSAIDCSTVRPPQELTAQVLTADGVTREVPIPMPPADGLLSWPQQMFCSPSEGPLFLRAGVVIEKGEDFLTSSVEIENSRAEEIEVSGVLSDNQAFTAHGVDLPWHLPPSESRNQPSFSAFKITWRLDDCAAASAVVPSEIRARLVIAGETQGIEQQWLLSEAAVEAELIRLGVTACR